MISIVVPTYNRAYTLGSTLPSMFSQDLVNEIVLVCDGGADDSEKVFAEVAARFPGVRAKFISDTMRKGAARRRNEGAQHATNEYVLFCDDDVFLECRYAAECLEALRRHGADAASGRIVYMRLGETQESAAARFGDGVLSRAPFNLALLEVVNSAKMTGDVVVPFTHGVVLTKAAALKTYGFDEFYAEGNGYREESDYQLNLSIHGLKVLITNRTRCFHMPMEQVRTGGQRTPRLRRLRSMIKNNNYFYDKYHERVREVYGLKLSRPAAKAVFALFAAYRVFLEPALLPIGRRLVYGGSSPGRQRRGLWRAGLHHKLALWLQLGLANAFWACLLLGLEGCR